MPSNLFRKIVVPLLSGCDSSVSLQVAQALARGRDILLVGIVRVEETESLSKGALPARSLRKWMREWKEELDVRVDLQIRVANRPWDELVSIVQSEQPDLLILEDCHFRTLGISLQEALKRPPCSFAVIAGEVPRKISSLVVAQRGGPSAELTLRIGLSIAEHQNAELTTLHLLPKEAAPVRDNPYKGIERVLQNLPRVRRAQASTDDPARAILDESEGCDLLIMGATVRPQGEPVGIGPIAETVLAARSKATLIVKILGPLNEDMESELVGQNAISVLVDKWFAENTYHAEEFSDLEALVRLKHRQNLKVSLALPALNEEDTVGSVIGTLKRALMDEVPVLDEMVLMDSNSTDRTREIAAGLGLPVYIHQHVLANYGARRGKGEALWKSLYVTSGDIILWLDTDIVNISPGFIYGLLGPLLLNPGRAVHQGLLPAAAEGGRQDAGQRRRAGDRIDRRARCSICSTPNSRASSSPSPVSMEAGARHWRQCPSPRAMAWRSGC